MENEILQKANELVTTNPQEAIKLYLQIMASDLENDYLYYQIGICYVNLNNYNKAKSWFLKALDLGNIDVTYDIINLHYTYHLEMSIDELQSYFDKGEAAGYLPTMYYYAVYLLHYGFKSPIPLDINKGIAVLEKFKTSEDRFKYSVAYAFATTILYKLYTKDNTIFEFESVENLDMDLYSFVKTDFELAKNLLNEGYEETKAKQLAIILVNNLINGHYFFEKDYERAEKICEECKLSDQFRELYFAYSKDDRFDDKIYIYDCPQDFGKAKECLFKGIEANPNYSAIYYILYLNYLDGLYGFEKDQAKAIHYLSLCAEIGNIIGMKTFIIQYKQNPELFISEMSNEEAKQKTIEYIYSLREEYDSKSLDYFRLNIELIDIYRKDKTKESEFEQLLLESIELSCPPYNYGASEMLFDLLHSMYQNKYKDGNSEEKVFYDNKIIQLLQRCSSLGIDKATKLLGIGMVYGSHGFTPITEESFLKGRTLLDSTFFNKDVDALLCFYVSNAFSPKVESNYRPDIKKWIDWANKAFNTPNEFGLQQLINLADAFKFIGDHPEAAEIVNMTVNEAHQRAIEIYETIDIDGALKSDDDFIKQGACVALIDMLKVYQDLDNNKKAYSTALKLDNAGVTSAIHLTELILVDLFPKDKGIDQDVDLCAAKQHLERLKGCNDPAYESVVEMVEQILEENKNLIPPEPIIDPVPTPVTKTNVTPKKKGSKKWIFGILIAIVAIIAFTTGRSSDKPSSSQQSSNSTSTQSNNSNQSNNTANTQSSNSNQSSNTTNTQSNNSNQSSNTTSTPNNNSNTQNNSNSNSNYFPPISGGGTDFSINYNSPSRYLPEFGVTTYEEIGYYKPGYYVGIYAGLTAYEKPSSSSVYYDDYPEDFPMYLSEFYLGDNDVIWGYYSFKNLWILCQDGHGHPWATPYEY